MYALVYWYSTQKWDVKEPPVIASGIPFIGHLIGMAIYGGRYIKDLGIRNRHLPIFTLPVPRSRIYIVTEPSLAAAVQRASKVLSFTPIIPEVTERVLGLDKATMDITRKNLDPGPGGKRGFLADIQDMVYVSFGPGAYLNEISLEAARELRSEILAFGASWVAEPGLEKPVDLLAWVRHVVTVSTAKYFYGPQNPLAIDPNLEENFWDFDRGLGKLLMNVLPSVTAGKAYKGRELLVRALEEYLENGRHRTGSVIVKKRVEIALRHGWTLRATARSELSFLFAGIVNATTSTFWILLQIFAEPELLSMVREEVAETLRPAGGGEDAHLKNYELNISDLRDRCPMLIAVYRECLRLGSDNYSTRMVKENTLLADRYYLKKGAVVQIAGGVMHADRSIWGDSVEEFNPTRFLAGGQQLGNAKQMPIHPAAFRAFGGGKTLCPGRHFAMNEILTLVSLTILMFDMKAPDGGKIKVPRKNDGVLPVHILEPISPVKVLVSRRYDGYAETCSKIEFNM
ncbi:putative cytochrome P450 [Rosellinia necatrix]|uniref:Putative cytochrome P450 n=1 Tax=Rosellinia necatrix TaxID=77044 RepID=A0A1W2TRW9_ROSNE|nr:putative cytochrome P450 [Rosellinia necatrix]